MEALKIILEANLLEKTKTISTGMYQLHRFLVKVSEMYALIPED